jgi:hypothetical protein
MILTEFLAARLDEDAKIAIVAAAQNPGSAADKWSAEKVDRRDEDSIVRKHWAILPERVKGVVLAEVPLDILPRVVTHLARHDPARVLAEVEAKRRILDLAGEWQAAAGPGADFARQAAVVLDRTLRLLALPYADHPDYDPEWRP